MLSSKSIPGERRHRNVEGRTVRRVWATMATRAFPADDGRRKAVTEFAFR